MRWPTPSPGPDGEIFSSPSSGKVRSHSWSRCWRASFLLRSPPGCAAGGSSRGRLVPSRCRSHSSRPSASCWSSWQKASSAQGGSAGAPSSAVGLHSGWRCSCRSAWSAIWSPVGFCGSAIVFAASSLVARSRYRRAPGPTRLHGRDEVRRLGWFADGSRAGSSRRLRLSDLTASTRSSLCGPTKGVNHEQFSPVRRQPDVVPASPAANACGVRRPRPRDDAGRSRTDLRLGRTWRCRYGAGGKPAKHLHLDGGDAGHVDAWDGDERCRDDCGPGQRVLAFGRRREFHSDGTTRTYYIAADQVVWDYAPKGRNEITGKPFDDVADTYVKSGRAGSDRST